MNSNEYYDKARNESEPEFAALLKKHGFKDVRQGTRLDDFNHIDVFASNQGIELAFDVKDVQSSYAKKQRNYNISLAMMDDINAHKEKYKNHIIACRLYDENEKATGEYALFRTLEVIKHVVLKECCDDASKKFWLFNVEQCIKEMNSNQWRLLS